MGVGHGMGVHDSVCKLLEFSQAKCGRGLRVAPCTKVLTHTLIEGAAPSSASAFWNLHDHGRGGKAITHAALRQGLLLWWGRG